MKKAIKILSIFLFTILIIGLSKNVEANTTNKISMDIYIEENGDAQITEVWDCYNNQGTEVYHPYYNLGNSEIKDLTVSEQGKSYQTLKNWNTSESFENKAYKCGINKTEKSVELCWGISKYGRHTYTVKYTITNLVSELEDAQMLYWTFIPHNLSTSIGSAYIKVHTKFKIPNTVDVWGYGNYGGTAYVYNGYIEMQSDGRLDKNEYMTMLVKFPKGSFKTSNFIENNFNYYLNKAEEGSTKYNKDDNSEYGVNLAEYIAFWIYIIGISIIPIIYLLKRKYKYPNYPVLRTKDKRIPKNIPYYRDIPCNGDIFIAYYIAYTYGLIKNKTDILGAVILKWIKEGNATIEKCGIGEEEQIAVALRYNDLRKIKNQEEMKLFKMLYQASEDGILESQEFKKWCEKQYSRILDWFDTVLESSRLELKRRDLIVCEEKKILGVFKKKVDVLTLQLREKATQLAGLKKYLKEYTLIKEREAVEVTLFEDYLIYAQMLGIAKEVAKEFKELYPEVIEQSKFSSYNDIIFVNYYAGNIVTSAQSARTQTERRASDYSAGGDGFSSGGGGGDSFGGGDGGRRIPLIHCYLKF